MSRFCKTNPDDGRADTHKWIYGVDFPPPSDDYARVKEWKVPRVYDRVEALKETDFKDAESDLSDVGEDEPTERGNPMWTKICDEHRAKTQRVLDVYNEVKRREERRICGDAPETEYVAQNLFPMLGPALEATLHKEAKTRNKTGFSDLLAARPGISALKVVSCLHFIFKLYGLSASELAMLKRERCGFDPVDVVSELLWNMNPRCPKRAKYYRPFFDIVPFKKWLRTHPRPDFPRNYFWNREESALCIQRNYRGYLVRRIEKVQQLRTFWRVLKGQKPPPDADPELTFGADIGGYKEHYPDLAKWNEEQQAKRKEQERVQWLKEEGLWEDEITEAEDEPALEKERSHLRSKEMYSKQVEQLVDQVVELAEAKQKPPVEIVNFGLTTNVNMGSQL